MDSPPLSLQVLATLQARHAFVEDLGRKLHELGLPALVFHEHFHGAAMACLSVACPLRQACPADLSLV